MDHALPALLEEPPRSALVVAGGPVVPRLRGAYGDYCEIVVITKEATPMVTGGVVLLDRTDVLRGAAAVRRDLELRLGKQRAFDLLRPYDLVVAALELGQYRQAVPVLAEFGRSVVVQCDVMDFSTAYWFQAREVPPRDAWVFPPGSDGADDLLVTFTRSHEGDVRLRRVPADWHEENS